MTLRLFLVDSFEEQKPRIFIIVVFSCFFWYVVMIHFLENVNNKFQDGGYIYIYMCTRVFHVFIHLYTKVWEKAYSEKNVLWKFDVLDTCFCVLKIEIK